MIPCAISMCVVQSSMAAQIYSHGVYDGRYLWIVLGLLLSGVWPFALVARSKYPEPVFWICLAVTVLFPYDPLLMLMALCSLIARRSGIVRTVRAVAAATPVAVWAQLRDALQPAEASLWHLVFAKPYTGGAYGGDLVMLVGEPTIIATAIVVALTGVTVSVLSGLHIRSRARLHEADAKTRAAQHHAAHLQNDLDNQQLADAIAAEAHDTLAHSLSLIALNASALQAEANRLAHVVSPDGRHEPADPQETRRAAETVAAKADEIRRQAAGALDEAHSVIDMLRHPQQAWERLAPTDDTALTRESLTALLDDARQAGERIDTWIDIRQLGDLDDSIGKVAYRAVQESLTNARRHAPDAPVSLEVTAGPDAGVHVHASNPTGHAGDVAVTTDDAGTPERGRGGAGLPGLAARVQEAGGTCRYGFDDRRVFHVDVTLPWTMADAAGPAAGTARAAGLADGGGTDRPRRVGTMKP
ncbi:sensor histidine kinase [Bifidobacterium sp. 82T10]|uniref:histidine kinase n=1 Tax=Bifidobacterium miconis TaxID=2834435 RepID=A0ABS6WBY8_9BIFI|nr:histidine kinase [Bifidobacterium miconis]MBW3091362.1 sensor histidine kinase [Bifidobacterium miconis]